MQEQFKKISLLFLFLTAGLISFSQDQAYSDNLLRRLEEMKNHSHAAAKIAGEEESHRECLSMLLKEAKKNFSKLTSEAQEVFSVLGSRPSLSGTALSYPTAHFRIHYTKSGVDAVDLKDTQGNNLPDFVDSMAAVFEYVYQQEIVNKGYYMPPADGTFGGDGKYDIYIQNIGTGLYGYVSSDDFKGNNPNSPQTETDSYTSYMVMNSKYGWVTGLTVIEAMKVTAAHEFFHGVQYGITIDCSGFFAESTATWMEDIVYPGIDDNFQYMSSVFNSPEIPLDYEDGETGGNTAYEGHWYGAWSFWRYVTDRFDDVDIVKEIWFRAINEYEYEAYDNELKERGTNFNEVFNGWLVANQLMTANDNYKPYIYDRAADYRAYLQNKYPSNGGHVKNKSLTNSVTSNLRRLAAEYYTVSTSSDFTVVLNSAAGNYFQMFVIKSNTNNSNFAVTNASASGNNLELSVSDASLYNQFTIVVSRFVNTALPAPTGTEQYTLTINGIVLSVNGSSMNLNSKIYPNPASEKFSIDYSIEQPSVMEVVDLSGKSIYTTELSTGNNNNLPVDASAWNPGVYFVIIKNQDGVVGRQRLVITQ